MNASRTNVILVILAIILLLAGAYVFAKGGSSSVTALTGSGVDAKQQAFVQLASQLGPVTFDASVLSDPRFTGLSDISTQVVPESAGRSDPFASIGAH